MRSRSRGGAPADDGVRKHVGDTADASEVNPFVRRVHAAAGGSDQRYYPWSNPPSSTTIDPSYAVYQTTSPGVVVFPIVFFLTFVAAVDQQPVLLTAFVQHKGWLIAHIILIFTGYAALVLSFGASLLYLLQERRLKAKKPSSLISFLPALEVIDQIGYRSLLLGFPFMTLGLITGSIVAMSAYGHVDFADPKILLSILMWFVYMVMVFTRWNSGWRGRRAAVLATFAFAAAVVAWAANYFSTIHRFAAS